MDIWVLTPSIPERHELLAEAVRSVQSQTHPVTAHIVGIDLRRQGPAVVRNRLLEAVPSNHWVTFLDDDDLWQANHLAALVRVQEATAADVVYSMCHITGRPGWDPQFDTFDEDRLRQYNYIPLNGIMRAGMLRRAGGFPTDGRVYEDWGMWLNMLDLGASFACTGERTWTYRFGDWDSRSKEVWDGRRS